MLVYASFDPFPAPKGAATHIAAFVERLAARFDEVALITVSPAEGAAPVALPAHVTHVPIEAAGRR